MNSWQREGETASWISLLSVCRQRNWRSCKPRHFPDFVNPGAWHNLYFFEGQPSLIVYSYFIYQEEKKMLPINSKMLLIIRYTMTSEKLNGVLRSLSSIAYSTLKGCRTYLLGSMFSQTILGYCDSLLGQRNLSGENEKRFSDYWAPCLMRERCIEDVESRYEDQIRFPRLLRWKRGWQRRRLEKLLRAWEVQP